MTHFSKIQTIIFVGILKSLATDGGGLNLLIFRSVQHAHLTFYEAIIFDGLVKSGSSGKRVLLEK